MSERSERRAAAIGGLLFVVLNVVANFLAPPPDTNFGADRLVRWYHDHAGAYKTAGVLAVIGSLGLIVFFGGLWRLMSDAEGGRPFLAVVALLSLAVSGALVFTAVTTQTVLALRFTEAGTTVRVFNTLANSALGAAGFSLALFITSVTVLTTARRLLPVGTNVVGVLAAIAFFVSGFSMATTNGAVMLFGLIGFLLWALWIVLVSVHLWRAGPEVDLRTPAEVRQAPASPTSAVRSPASTAPA